MFRVVHSPLNFKVEWFYPLYFVSEYITLLLLFQLNFYEILWLLEYSIVQCLKYPTKF